MRGVTTRTMPEPLYSGHNVHPAYEIRYTWTGWPSRRGEPFPNKPPEDLFASLKQAWEADGLRLLEYHWTEETIQLALSTKPDVSPVFCAARIKGRLQHALRAVGCPRKFSRKVALRTVGHNARKDVEGYIRKQVPKEGFADSRFAERLKGYHQCPPDVDLSAPSVTSSGRYWYNLHLVLVTAGRYRLGEDETLKKLSDGCMAIAGKKGHLISELSIMPDHLHVALRGSIEQAPHEIALAFQNNLAYQLGQFRVWEDGYYVGTFGDYDMQAVRRRADGE